MRCLITSFICCLALLSGCDVSKGTGTAAQGTQDADPVFVDASVAYIERPMPKTNNGNIKPDAMFSPADFNAGAHLILKARAQASAPEINITETIFPPIKGAAGTLTPQLYDVKDPSPSRDGKKLLFALRAPTLPNTPAELQPTWDIWEYDRASAKARPIFSNSDEAALGQDVQPAYLPDGRIVFSSNRQTLTRQQILDRNGAAYRASAEGTNEYSYNLHVVNPDGSELQQLTVNPAMDLYPRLLTTGEIVFLRRDRLGGNDSLSFYTIKPDGSELSFYYGYHSKNIGSQDKPATYFNPQVQEDGKILASLRPRSNTRHGGDLITLDVEQFYERNQSLNSGNGTAQASISKDSAYSEPLGTAEAPAAPSPGGYFQAAFPLDDKEQRYLVSWSACRVLDATTKARIPCKNQPVELTEAEPLYSLWMYNGATQTQLPVSIPPATSTMNLFNPVILADKPLLPLAAGNTSSTLSKENAGILHIYQVNDLALPAYQGAKYLRVLGHVPLPKNNDLELIDGAFGVGGRGAGMYDILAYAPIETDGSIKLKLPALVPLTLELLDAKGHRVGPRHQNWITLGLGETRECKGCHIANNANAPHGRLSAEPLPATPSIASGLPERIPSLGVNNLSHLNIAQTHNTAVANCLPPETTITWPLPTNKATCLTEWTPGCASTINYLEHIQPLWQVDRRVCDAQRAVTRDLTCIRCHDRTAPARMQEAGADALTLANFAALNVQLDLRPGKNDDNDNFNIAYTQLFTAINEQEYVQQVDGSYLSQEKLYPTPVTLTQEDGTQITEIQMLPRAIAPRLDTAGARSTRASRFLTRFNNAADANHYQGLSVDEQFLIGEWLDVGAQYYNEPSKAREEN
ncbi:MAG: hypothetical protein RL497_268 [Pseudomonadota bacterium]|jgi:hypothetical protein